MQKKIFGLLKMTFGLVRCKFGQGVKLTFFAPCKYSFDQAPLVKLTGFWPCFSLYLLLTPTLVWFTKVQKKKKKYLAITGIQPSWPNTLGQQCTTNNFRHSYACCSWHNVLHFPVFYCYSSNLTYSIRKNTKWLNKLLGQCTRVGYPWI